jgi:NAD(P)-dependent dehydrogenase (short-subunit alcohol dehydrogenase family)
MGGLDIVVSASELPMTAPLEKMSEMELARVVALNFSSHLFTIRSAAAEFRRNEAGPNGRGIVLVLTRAMSEHSAEQTAFYAAQAGAQQLVRESAVELADAGVRVNALAVGEDESRVASVALRLMTTDDTGMVVTVG